MISETIRHPSPPRQLDCRCWRLKAVQSRRFLSFPQHPRSRFTPLGSGIPELFVSNTPQHYSPKARWIFPGLRKIGTAVCSQAIRKTTFLPSLPSFLPLSVGGTSPPPTSRGLRRIQGWQLPPGRAPSSRFLRILTPSSPFSLYTFFFVSFPLVYFIGTLNFVLAFYQSAKSNDSSIFSSFGDIFCTKRISRSI